VNPVVDVLAALIPNDWPPSYALRVLRFLNLVVRAIWKVYGPVLADEIALAQGTYHDLGEFLPDDQLQDPYDEPEDDRIPF
jgi:hypothetical protein